jgi:glycerol uptake facilitator-like aquaporin
MFFPKLLVEFLGTFVFLLVVQRVGKAVPIAIALLAMIYLGTGLSSHFNPAISCMKWASGELSGYDCFMFVATQVVAGLCALKFNSYLSHA